eukprot:m.85114 g.85114  ORF g.85114 m.85114 type:complete len:95 (-) comp25833_c0_seq1:210-494(-)
MAFVATCDIAFDTYADFSQYLRALSDFGRVSPKRQPNTHDHPFMPSRAHIAIWIVSVLLCFKLPTILFGVLSMSNPTTSRVKRKLYLLHFWSKS